MTDTPDYWTLSHPGGAAAFVATDEIQMSVRLVGAYLNLGAPRCPLTLSARTDAGELPVQDWPAPSCERLAEDARNLFERWFDLARSAPTKGGA